MSLRAFLSRRVVTPEGVRPAAILVEGEQIREVVVDPNRMPAEVAETLDFGDAAILPGLVDSHVHINDPGRADWEGFETATRAAAAGGYTLLVDMPLNCLPATTDVAALEAKRLAAKGRCRVDWMAWGGVVEDNQHCIEPLAKAGIAGFKCFLVHPGIDGFTMVTEEQLREALPHVARSGLPLLVHAELPGPINAATESLANADWTLYETYLSSRPEEAELGAIRMLLRLCREFRFRLHIVHLSASQALSELHAARTEGLAVSVETCPHYLYLKAEEIPRGATLFKCAPPVRGGKNRDALWQGLRDRVIDLVATDHSPCPPEMKRLGEGNFGTAWGGIASLSLALPLMYTAAIGRGFSLQDIARWMAEAPAKLAGCDGRKGRIAAGNDADFVIFDPESEFEVSETLLHYRHAVSPYLGEKLRGKVEATYLRGNLVFKDGEFPGEPRGREYQRTMKNGRIVGTSVPRQEGRGKVTGEARYVDDMVLPDMLYGATVRSRIARGRIKKIVFGPVVDWNEFVIVSAKDIPGKNCIALIEDDQPCLADGAINHPEEAILLLAHPDRHLLPKAVAAISIETDPLPGIFTNEESERRSEIIWGEDNIFKSYLIEKGDVDKVWQHADHIVEGEYETGAQEQLYIENNGMIAAFDPQQGVTVWGSLQCPYYVHKALMKLLGLSAERVRVIQMETGGAFGGKEEYPSMIAGHAALLAMKSGKPVKIIYDRMEDMAATTKRHPSRTRHRTAVSADGKILAGEIEFVIDGGAYKTLSPVVLSRGAIHAGGPYYWPSIRIRAKAVATNTPPHGAFRGFGAPQSLFALERHMDRIAKVVGLSPAEIRRQNFLKRGQTTTTEQTISEQIDLDKLLERGLELSDYHAKRQRFAKENPARGKKKGIGIAAFLHGAGFTGSGERYLGSVVGVEACADGSVRVVVSSTEFGQGTKTVLCQIAAEALGLRYGDVGIAQPDTQDVPNSGPTVASRTVMVVGKLVQAAAIGVRQTLAACGMLGESYSPEEFRYVCRAYVAEHGSFRSLARYEQPDEIVWDDEKYRGSAYAAFAWAVYVAEVTVDLTTYGVTVDDFVALQEVGKVLHPVLAKGQIIGGVAQGIGFALYEKVVWDEGRMQNGQMTNYIMPTSADLPLIRVYFEELGNHHGAYGAKGIGELPMDGPAPAILNAVEDALGVPFDSIPLLPEDIFDAMRELVEPEKVPVAARGSE